MLRHIHGAGIKTNETEVVMLSKLLLERLKVFFLRNQRKPREMWRVRFRSDATGAILDHFTDTREQAQLFRSAFNLGRDPSTAPERVMN